MSYVKFLDHEWNVEVIRIFSARKAEEWEVLVYEEYTEIKTRIGQ